MQTLTTTNWEKQQENEVNFQESKNYTQISYDKMSYQTKKKNKTQKVSQWVILPDYIRQYFDALWLKHWCNLNTFSYFPLTISSWFQCQTLIQVWKCTIEQYFNLFKTYYEMPAIRCNRGHLANLSKSWFRFQEFSTPEVDLASTISVHFHFQCIPDLFFWLFCNLQEKF